MKSVLVIWLQYRLFYVMYITAKVLCTINIAIIYRKIYNILIGSKYYSL